MTDRNTYFCEEPKLSYILHEYKLSFPKDLCIRKLKAKKYKVNKK